MLFYLSASYLYDSEDYFEIKKNLALRGFSLFLLLVDGVLLGDRVELFGFVLLARVLLDLVVKTSVVDVTFPNAVLIAE